MSIRNVKAFSGFRWQRINQNLHASDLDSLLFCQQLLSFGQNTKEVNQKRASFLAMAYEFNKNNAPQIPDRLVQGNFDKNRIVFIDLQKTRFNYSNHFIQSSISIKLLPADNDIISVETALTIHKSFGNARLIILDKCGHYDWLDAKNEYFSPIKKLMNDK